MINPHTNQFCGGCTYPLSGETVTVMADLMSEISSDPQFLQRITQMVLEAQNAPKS